MSIDMKDSPELNTHSLYIAACEDKAEDAALLAKHIKGSGFDAQCSFFESGEEFLAAFRPGMYDLIFMDIYMKGMRGIETVESIRRTDPDVIIAFCTSSPDHTRESYQLKALRYLDKPVSSDDVKGLLELVLTIKKSRPSVTVTLTGGQQAEIFLDSIMYFEHKGHVIEVHTTGKIITTSQSARLDDFEKQLPSPPFMRCHRSYLINLDYVHKADKEINAFVMKNGDRADIRRGRFAELNAALLNWRMDKAGRSGT